MSGYFTYVLQSKIDGKFYTGYTSDLEKRVYAHNSGKVCSTKKRIPFELIYFEYCRNINDALHREKYLKTTYGKRYIKNRLKNYLSFQKNISQGRDQIQRSAVSIPSNIAEGDDLETDKQSVRHFYITKGSAAELLTQLIIAQEIGYLDTITSDTLVNDCKIISVMLTKLIKARSK